MLLLIVLIMALIFLNFSIMSNKKAVGRTDGVKQIMRSYRIDKKLVEKLSEIPNVNKFVNEAISEKLNSPSS